jgi:hypothetical protein
MKYKSGILVVASILAGAGYGFYDFNRERQGTALVAVGSSDLGEVAASSSLIHEFEVRNITRRHLTIDDIRLSCWCTEVFPKRFTLKPGATQKLTAKLDLLYNKQGST